MKTIAVLFAGLLLATPGQAQQQPPPAGGVVAPQPGGAAAAPPAPAPASPFYLELGKFHHSFSRGAGQRDGESMRLFYTTPRATPILSISRQTDGNDDQFEIGLSSYVTLSERFYAIVGVSHAPDSGTELFPKLRLDATLLGNVPRVRGLVLSAGITDIYGAQDDSGGTIYSIGSLYYRGRAISSGVVRFNRDRRSGAPSESFQIATQYGQQGRYWVGASLTHGTEAYQLGGAVPFDVRFEGTGASAFLQRWVTEKQGFAIRLEYEHKYGAYVRSGGAITYFVDF